MLQFKQGRFYIEGISFLLPEGFYLEKVQDEYCGNRITAWDSNRICSYRWIFYEGLEQSKKELEWRARFASKTFSEVTPIVRNGLSGHWLIYMMGYEDGYFEVQFDLPEKKRLVLFVQAYQTDICKAIKSPDFKAVLKGIQMEPNSVES